MSHRTLSPHRRLAAALLLCALALPARASAELFFSEVVEGSSNNKALEVYNPGTTAVDLGLGGYSVQMFFNGNASPGLTINLAGVVAPGGAFVLAHASSAAAILAVADQTNGAGWFNGDDAIVLRRAGTVIDSIGQIGVDPGSEWGSGLVSTGDNTLRRKPSVCQGDPDATDAFDPSLEWDGFPQNAFDGLGAHACGEQPPPPPVPTLEIWEIQGAGLASPYAGQTVRTEDNVVTAVAPNGFFLQTPEGRADLDPETSNGIFVFTGSAPAVQVGDQVDLTGLVAEFFELTEITGAAVTVDSMGHPLPAPVGLGPSVPSPFQPQPATELERYEGMLVRVENGTATAPTDRFGDTAIVAGPARAFREPGLLFPGLPGLPVWDGNPEIFEIDADRMGLPDLDVPAGALVEVAEGPLGFAFGDYQIWPTTLSVAGTPEVVPVRPRRPGELTVGSQNLLRLFDTVNDPASSDAVASPAEYARRLQKVSLLIREALRAPDVLAVQEVENIQVLEDVAARIEADDPSVVYIPYLLEGNDVGGIDVGFLVRDTVQVDLLFQLGAADTFEFGGATSPLNDRPPLVLQGAYVGNGAPFPLVVVAVHQRSLGGIDGNDGARVRAKRYEQAVRLAEALQGFQEADPNLRLVVAGDFNAFQFTDGYVDVMGIVTGELDPAGALLPGVDLLQPNLTNQILSEPEGERYSFVFDGSAQSLDHALTSSALNPFVRGLDHARGNADAPARFGMDATTALGAADHDGLVLYVMTDSDADGVAEDLDLCPGTALPEPVPTKKLLPNHYALVDGDGTFDTTLPPGAAAGPAFTLDQTGGCSCDQIATRLGLGDGHRKHGCNGDVMNGWISSLAD